MSVFIKSLDREVEIKPYTRGIARQVNEKLMEGVVVSNTERGQETNIVAVNGPRSEELLVRLMTGLSQTEIDGLLNEEYESLKAAVNEETQKKSEMMK